MAVEHPEDRDTDVTRPIPVSRPVQWLIILLLLAGAMGFLVLGISGMANAPTEVSEHSGGNAAAAP